MGDREDQQRLERFYEHLAEAASEDETLADKLLRARGLDPDEEGASMMAEIRRVIARAKTEDERSTRKASGPDVDAYLQSLLKEFDSAVEALQQGLSGERLSVQYRNLEEEPTEGEAREMLREEIELRLSGDSSSSNG